ncbi:MAG: pilus assembly protein PilM [Deltaproteobacteria bacterium]|nr:pilus assembly protein PilM [Deltaproteobacteria bacterium]MBW2019199.1 pilus assembly protein PilM [Deltaproteobacteria bacterium]MBW2074002.1 pilus assembly protein PilM [Deltaproteobacteria bacterium]
MPRTRILGLDISSDAVAAVQVTGGLRKYDITACGHVLIEEAGGLDEALKALFEQKDLKGDTCITSIPGEHVSYRNLRMPFGDKKKIRQTLPFELETMVPFAIEDLLVDFIIADQTDQSEILAASVKRAYIAEHLARLQACGIDPDILDIGGVPTVSWLLKQAGTPDNGLLLEIGLKRNTMILYLKRRIVLIRTFPFNGRPIAQAVFNEMNSGHADTQAVDPIESCFASFYTEVQNTLHAFEWQNKKTVHPERIFITGSGSLYPDTENALSRLFDLPVEQINLSRDTRVRMNENIARSWNPAFMNSALALALRGTKQNLGFNFRRDQFEVKKQYFGHKKEIRRAAAFLMVILFLLALDLGVDNYLLKKHYRELNQQITEIFRQTFPEVTRIVDPVQQMKVKIREIKKSALLLPGMSANRKVLDLLRDISERVPESVDVHVTRIVVDPDVVLIRGETDTFNTVDTIKKKLEPSTYFNAVAISSANLARSGNRVQFEMKLERTR